MRRTSRLLAVALVGLLLVALTVGMAACSSGSDSDTGADTGTTGTDADIGDDGTGSTAEPVDSRRELVETKCSLCHTTDRVWAADYNTEQWIGVIERMKKNGLVVSIESEALILDYLTTQ
ncbi:MAG: hypothetical protein PF636_07575 [Actinomycetota bacterium]|jgi:hypothetical protein|nr:hypothetical protein [Actinomycetota bacterium]